MTVTRSKSSIAAGTRQTRNSLKSIILEKKTDHHPFTPFNKRRKMRSDDIESTDYIPAAINTSTHTYQSQSMIPLTPDSSYESISSLPSPPSTPLVAPVSESSSGIEDITSEIPPSSADQVMTNMSSRDNDASDNKSARVSSLARMSIDWTPSTIMNAFLPIFRVKASTDPSSADIASRINATKSHRSNNIVAVDAVAVDSSDRSAMTGHMSEHSIPTPPAASQEQELSMESDECERSIDTPTTEPVLRHRLSARPTVYEEYSQNGIDWCRYCGATQTSQAAAFRPGIWGTRTLCNKHGCDVKGYGRANKQPRLTLALFARETRADRIRPIIQDFCHVCFKDASQEIVVMCDGCWQAFHPSCCFGGAIPQKVIDGTCDSWYCDPFCQTTRTSCRIDVVLPRITLPYMLDVVSSSTASSPSKSSSKRKRSTTANPSKSAKATVSERSVSRRRTFPSVSEAYPTTRRAEEMLKRQALEQDIVVPDWSVSTVVVQPSSLARNSSVAMAIRKRATLSALDSKSLQESRSLESEEEDLSDEAFNLRHEKYESIERKSRMGILS